MLKVSIRERCLHRLVIDEIEKWKELLLIQFERTQIGMFVQQCEGIEKLFLSLLLYELSYRCLYSFDAETGLSTTNLK